MGINEQVRMMFKKILIACILLVCILASGLPYQTVFSQSQQTAMLEVTPPQARLAPGQSATILVGVSDALDLYGFDISLTYDPAFIEVLDADPTRSGTQVSNGDMLSSGWEVVNQADETSGKIRLAMSQTNPALPVSGSGSLMKIQVRALNPGISPLRLVYADLVTRDGWSHLVSLGSNQAEVVIEGGVIIFLPLIASN